MENVIETHVYYSLNINGVSIPFITDAVISMFIIVFACAIILHMITRKLSLVPTGSQSVAETIIDLMGNLSKNQIGRHGKTFAPFLTTLILFLAFSNMLGIFNVIPSGKTLSAIFNNPALENFTFNLHPPTKNFNVTLGLAIVSIVVVIFSEFKFKGVKGWARGFYKPNPVSGFVRILDYIVRPMSLCLRLFGNILGGAIVMALIYSMLPIAVPSVIGAYFDLFDGGLQAYVFVFLTSIYLAEAVNEEEEEEKEKDTEEEGKEGKEEEEEGAKKAAKERKERTVIRKKKNKYTVEKQVIT